MMTKRKNFTDGPIRLPYPFDWFGWSGYSCQSNKRSPSVKIVAVQSKYGNVLKLTGFMPGSFPSLFAITFVRCLLSIY